MIAEEQVYFLLYWTVLVQIKSLSKIAKMPLNLWQVVLFLSKFHKHCNTKMTKLNEFKSSSDHITDVCICLRRKSYTIPQCFDLFIFKLAFVFVGLGLV